MCWALPPPPSLLRRKRCDKRVGGRPTKRHPIQLNDGNTTALQRQPACADETQMENGKFWEWANAFVCAAERRTQARTHRSTYSTGSGTPSVRPSNQFSEVHTGSMRRNERKKKQTEAKQQRSHSAGSWILQLPGGRVQKKIVHRTDAFPLLWFDWCCWRCLLLRIL